MSAVHPDLLPVPPERRTWGLWHFAGLWVSVSVCIPTYMLASGMVAAGMSWRLSLLAVFLGNAIVLVPMIVNGHAGTKYGIPFPIYARASFGVAGAHVPALLRAVVACGWFGIQTWIGGLALSVLIHMAWDDWFRIADGAMWMDQPVPLYLSFAAFWLLNMAFVWWGTESIKWLETLAAPVLIVLGLALLWWAAGEAGGLGAALQAADRLESTEAERGGRFWLTTFVPWLTAMVGFWATLALSIPDFTRFARSQKDQAAGQALGLLTTMPLFAFIGVAVTSGTLLLYGEAIWNPIDLVARIATGSAAWVGVVALGAVLLATLTTNIAANIVAPANAFAALAPRRIGFRAGGLLAGAIGVLLFPWLLLDVYQSWLIGYSGLLGAAGGVVLCDYALVRRGRLDVDALYERTPGIPRVRGAGIAALLAGIAVALLGLAAPSLRFLFDGAWFSGGIVAAAVYYGLVRGRAGV